jgi:hypothetical protein
MIMTTQQRTQTPKVSAFYLLHGAWHRYALALYMVLVLLHATEHVVQIVQAFVLAWSRPDAGGVLGLWFPQLASAELLHFSYNFFQLSGLLVLRGGFQGRARRWWTIAIGFQAWHFFEHTLLQVQWLTGFYLFNQPQQTSLLQMFVPRIELHFIYNMLVVVPTLVAVYLYMHDLRKQGQ